MAGFRGSEVPGFRGSGSLAAAVALACTAIVAIATIRAQQPLFRTNVEYVSVDVVVTDKNDKPITDLTKADFVITENKKAQTIRDFQYVSVPVEHRTFDVTQPQPPEPDVATNIPPSPKSRLFALIIDDLHILEADLIPVKRVMTEFVQALSPNDEVAVVFVGRSDLSQNFTTNTGRILKTIDRLKDALGFGMDSMGHTQVVRLQDGVPGYNREVLGYTRSMLSVLRNVSASLAGSGHARRAIVYVGNGTNMDFTPDMRTNGVIYWSPDMLQKDVHVDEYIDAMTMRDEMNDVFDASRRADVPIYTLDPRGLLQANSGVRGGIGATGQMDGPFVAGQRTVQQEIEHRFRNELDSLASVAINTGGRAFTNQSNLTKAIDEIVGENGSYYLLGYSPDPVVRDGKYHPIDVKVTRPGLIVRPRAGYVASRPATATADVKPTLDKAMGAGVNVSGLSLRAFAAPVASTAAGITTVVTIQLTCPAPIDGSTSLADNLQLSLVALDPDAKVKASFTRALHFTMPVPSGAGTVSFLINDTITLPSQSLTLRVGIASESLDRAGTTQLSVDVPKPSDSKLQLGGIVLGYADFMREAALQREMIRDLVPFQPTTARTFVAKDTLRVFDRIFWGSKDAAADATLTIVGGPARAPQLVHLTGAPAASNPSRREAILDTRVSLAGLPAGAYTLHVEARLATGQTTQRDVPFEVR